MSDLVLSLDVGGKVDFAAVIGLEIHHAFGGEKVFRVVHTDRILGLSTTQLGDSFLALTRHFASRYSVVPVIDARGVGAGPFDALADAGAQPLGILATSGFSQASRPKVEAGGHALSMTVSNDQLIRSLRAAMTENHLKFAEGLSFGDELKRELLTTTPSLTEKKKSTSFSAPSGEHDDLASALMLACWAARWLGTSGQGVRRRLGPNPPQAVRPMGGGTSNSAAWT